MTGPEHYAEAERLLTVAGDGYRKAERLLEGSFSREEALAAASLAAAPIVAAAQVHATLALAAATATTLPERSETGQDNRHVLAAWHGAGAW